MTTPSSILNAPSSPPPVLPSLHPVGFWRTFDVLSTGKALLITWRSLSGADFLALKPFLQPTPEHSHTYPCPMNPWCECDHEVREDAEWELVGVCTCGECEPVPLTRQDTILYALNRPAFAEAIRQALGFAPPPAHASLCAPHSPLLQVGLHPPLHAPVYFYAPTSTDALSSQVNALVADHAGPFLLLTPASTFTALPMQAALARAASAHVALDSILAPSQLSVVSHSACSAYSAVSPIPHSALHSPHLLLLPTLEAWSTAVASHPSPHILEGLHQEIAAVRHDFVELRTAKQRLEQMQAGGMFAFTRKVDATSFKILCAILAEGDVAKAGRTLGIGDPMMRKTLRQWRTRGPAYQAMLDLVRWRKKVGRKETMPLNDAILHEKADTTDYPALLSDVLDGLLSMTETNWQDLAEELAELLRPAIAAGSKPNPARPTPVRGGQ